MIKKSKFASLKEYLSAAEVISLDKNVYKVCIE